MREIKTYIIATEVNRMWWNSLKDVRVYGGADVDSDHNLSVTTIRLSLAALKQQNKQLKYNTANLLNRDMLVSFEATIGGKFHALAELDEASDINEEWANFTRTVSKAATEHLGYRKRRQVEWITSELRDLIDKTM